MRLRMFGYHCWAVIHHTMRDRVAAFFILALPFAIIGLSGTVLAGATDHPLGIFAADHGTWARQLITTLSRDPGIKVSRYPTLAALNTAVSEQGVALGLIVPANFDGALDGPDVTTLAFVVEREELVPAALRLAVARDINTVAAMGLAAHYDMSIGHLDSAAAARRALSAGSAGPPGLRIEQVTRPTAAAVTGIAYAAPGNLVLFIFLNTVSTGAGLVALRRFGVARRMLSTASGPWLIALSETAGRIALGMVQAAVIVVAGALVFHVHWGPLAMVFTITVLAAAIGAALALISSAISATPLQATMLAPAVVLTTAMLGGCMWPLTWMWSPLRFIGRLFPAAWAMDALLTLSAADSVAHEVIVDAGVLLAFATAFTMIAVPLYRRRIAVG